MVFGQIKGSISSSITEMGWHFFSLVVLRNCNLISTSFIVGLSPPLAFKHACAIEAISSISSCPASSKTWESKISIRTPC
ncbi:Os02g0632150 [Oryza sativa Japonica Group]|uniref:Os02g0632150 protein n=1 Tax=Oryza sativa subsp. japonica TaxID=39947 RepID=A0A0P0VM33_ORYSJ|nr:hypothetical protein EE612_012554 [Oryza sativa]BAS79910.1 Os02g0632150 [Oryza sativa Japonica Group]